jgi:tetratricopeptide (TPR) repeat protein
MIGAITTSLLLFTVLALPPAMAEENLDDAYQALRARDYGRAISLMQRAIVASPQRISIRKDLAYTLLKTGETLAARDQFREAMKLDSTDVEAALEFAFLACETKQVPEARRVFDRIRKTGNATAEQAFQNIDRPLQEGIARWTQALTRAPGNFSAHLELARLAEERDELPLALSHYREAWRLKPEMKSLLLDIGRIHRSLGQDSEANAALLAASRGAEPRTAEQARELMSARYPYVYEFRNALEIDPGNLELRRELAFLLLAMQKKPEAEAEFAWLVAHSPADILSTAQLGFLKLDRGDETAAMPLLERVLASRDKELADKVRRTLKPPQSLKLRNDAPRGLEPQEVRTLAFRSIERNYFKDALKYLMISHENDPLDFQVMLQLGWTYNLLHDDLQAMRWFDLARRSQDPAIAAEARKAYNNLRPSFARIRTSAWLFPFFSTRWHDAFSYGQVKTELRLAKVPLMPYISLRFIGDARGRTSGLVPQSLSESSFILSAGVATPYAKGAFKGLMGWFEAGQALSYRSTEKNRKDFRGGLAYARLWKHRSLFLETNADGIFVSRFTNDMLVYSQTRTGFKLPSPEALPVQMFWNHNATVDLHGEYWANYVETGPGIRFQLSHGLQFSVNLLRGANLINEGNPRRPNYNDLRVGFSYAIVH